MSEIPPGLQLCPTRIDAAPVLFAHVVSPQKCQQRQRDSYHKCFTCVHNNAQVWLMWQCVARARAERARGCSLVLASRAEGQFFADA
jgi:hypothetical protein